MEADDLLGTCYRKAMTSQKLWTGLFPQKQRKEEVLRPDMPRTSGGHLGRHPLSNASVGPLKPWKTKLLGNVHDPSGVQKKISQKNFGLIFRSLMSGLKDYIAPDSEMKNLTSKNEASVCTVRSLIATYR